jgi:hypothetical protein
MWPRSKACYNTRLRALEVVRSFASNGPSDAIIRKLNRANHLRHRFALSETVCDGSEDALF